MSLFLDFFYGWREVVGFVVLWCFWRGVLGKEGVWVWCFDGEIVVECVADVVAKQWTFSRQKMRHHFELYFWAVLHRT
jgi:hypothetical protein